MTVRRINWVGVRNFLIIAGIAGRRPGVGGGLRRVRGLRRADHPVLFVAALAGLRLQLLPPEPARLARAEAVAAVRDHRGGASASRSC